MGLVVPFVTVISPLSPERAVARILPKVILPGANNVTFPPSLWALADASISPVVMLP